MTYEEAAWGGVGGVTGRCNGRMDGETRTLKKAATFILYNINTFGIHLIYKNNSMNKFSY